MKEFVGLRAKTYSYLKDKNDEGKTVKGTKKCVIKRKLNFQNDKKLVRSNSDWKENKLFRIKTKLM